MTGEVSDIVEGMFSSLGHLPQNCFGRDKYLVTDSRIQETLGEKNYQVFQEFVRL